MFGCAGSVTDDVMIAAMERIKADGMDVLNMSIGDAFNNWAGMPTAAAADALVDAGIVVVASIGNSGANGIYSAGAPGVGDKVIGVASYDNSHVQLSSFTISPDNRPVGYLPASGGVLCSDVGRRPDGPHRHDDDGQRRVQRGRPSCGKHGRPDCPHSSRYLLVLREDPECSDRRGGRGRHLQQLSAQLGLFAGTVAIQPAAGAP